MTLVIQMGTDAKTRDRPPVPVRSNSAWMSSPNATMLTAVITAIMARDSRRRFDSSRSTRWGLVMTRARSRTTSRAGTSPRGPEALDEGVGQDDLEGDGHHHGDQRWPP